MKKIFKIIGVIILLIIVAITTVIITYQPKKYSDFDVFTNLQNQVLVLLQMYGARERAVAQDFKNFSLHLSFPYSKIFGSSEVGVPLQSFQNSKISAATVTHFEVPARSSYYRDFTLHIRPQYGLKAPVFHIDFMKPMLGTPGLCIVDFFNVDKENISLEEFFGEELENVKKALSSVEKYQRSEKEGRGKITVYLNPYKSPFRYELKEPATDDETIRKAYYQTVEEALRLLFPAYLKSLHKLEPDESFAQRHEEKTKELMQLMYKNDVAINLGKKIFKEHFKHYWLDGFWNVEMELPE